MIKSVVMPNQQVSGDESGSSHGSDLSGVGSIPGDESADSCGSACSEEELIYDESSFPDDEQ